MRTRYKIPLVLFAVMAAALVLGGVYTFNLLHSPAQPATGEPARFVIEKGESLDSIGRRLKEEELINDPVALKLAAFFKGGAKDIKAGAHELNRGMSAWQLMDALRLSPHKEFVVVTIPEGKDRFEIAAIISAAGLLKETDFIEITADPTPISDLTPDATSLEGFLYPDTYHIPLDTTASQIRDIMLERSRHVLLNDFLPALDAAGMTMKEGLILASLIAKEAGNVEEMPLVSSVFHNRLKRDMRLESDPTFIYAAKLAGVWDRKIHQSDINRESPYNTYLHTGLPPGPIGNPGLEAMIAATEPAETNFLYFVAKGTEQSEGHVFSSTYSEHRKAVTRYRNEKRRADEND